MTTATARYGFPIINYLTDLVDVSVDFNIPWTTLDSLLGTQLCTSGARPSVPVEGQLIYETDTKVVRVWSGSAWVDAGVTTCLSSALPSNPITGDLAYTTDKNAFIAYNGTAWFFSSIVVCTSTTRPTVGIISGVSIWETDTLAYAEYTGSGWRYTSTLTCTSTTRPTGSNTALVIGTEAIETNTGRLILWTGSAWQQVNVSVCTSSTRPVNPLTGEIIYETDTGANATYTGSFYAYGIQQIAPRQVLSSTAASVTFTGIPPAMRIMLVWRARGTVSGTQSLDVRIDGNTGSAYLFNSINSASGTVSGNHSGALTTSMFLGSIDAATTSYFASGFCIIDGWSQTTGFATLSGNYANFNTASIDSNGIVGGQFNVVGPHTSITILPAANSLAIGSQFSLYGIE